MQKFKWRRYACGTGVVLLAFILFSGPIITSFCGVHAQVAEASGARAGQKEILVSLARQWMDVYQNGQEIYSTPVTTGSHDLPTPRGTYHIFYKVSPTTFHSPFPRTSKNWYPPVRVQYAMEWKAGGYFIHDSWWHTSYGPGTNVVHYDPTYGWQAGSHGCIAVPLEAAQWLYHWTAIGTTVKIVR
ncbi:MAG TPA: L,D-transpeptidase [Ktedonobacteraceae bacterium]|jgi:lipoprotein-anchoring transpeptidase ErfK/SrfK